MSFPDAGAVQASLPLGGPRAADDALKLWYEQPAAQWLEALPIGNGRLGAMAFGGTDKETLQLDEHSVWAGRPLVYDNPDGLAALPEIRRLVFGGQWSQAQQLVDQRFIGLPAGQMPYQPVGNLTLTFPFSGDVSRYRRELDLETAIARTTYARDGVRHTREIFASAPDQVIVIRLGTDRSGALSFTAAFDSPQQSGSSAIDDRTIALDGVSGTAKGIEGGVRFRALVRAINENGHVTTDGGALRVQGATTVTLLVSIGTSYRNYHDLSGDPAAQAGGHLAAATARPYDGLRGDHVTDHQHLFRRVELDLGTLDAAVLPTDQRVAGFASGNDPALVALHLPVRAVPAHRLVPAGRWPAGESAGPVE
ncbi:glycoside hydrolase family 95 protein [Actinomadura opuntiae]|uniref:glycoside hydrolase family 95 protein n=1 Tax=Actinomadura sp. OS1-43 TaxID=604315 RepID=UPI00255B32B0|nr:glycoside hydrolase family 95 protein [Actinomadura sp. OS1-43]MDL4818480.1 glycoside hydrolase family 95 protein [Actinomadura sp. OS1-43]